MGAVLLAIIVTIVIAYSSIQKQENGSLDKNEKKQKMEEAKTFKEQMSSSDLNVYKKVNAGERIEAKEDVLVVLKHGHDVKIAITKTMICPKSNVYLPVSAENGLSKSLYKLGKTTLAKTVSSTKKASVAGRAVAGAAIAGGVGAAIGAASAASANASGGVTKTKKVDSGDYALTRAIDFSLITNIEVSEKMGMPPHFKELGGTHPDGYYSICFGWACYRTSEEMLDDIIAFIDKKLIELNRKK